MKSNAEYKKIPTTELVLPSSDGIIAKLSTANRNFYNIIYLDTTDSTNLRAKELAREGCAEGTVVITSEQTAGRGRLGRKFHSPRGSGIYLSVVLRLGVSVIPERITTTAAVAVCNAAERCTNAIPEIKWVNDVLVDGRKVCGILTEGAASPRGGLDWAVLGIGINLTCPDGGFPPELDGIAGAVFEGGAPFADIADRMAAAVLDEFAALYEQLKSDSCDAVAREYADRCSTPGKSVTVIRGSERREAVALRLDDSLRLVVRYDDGTEEALTSGEVSVRPHDKT